MLLHGTDGDDTILAGSCVFFGFRFNMADENIHFDYDNYLVNKDDALANLGCKIIPINTIAGEYAITLDKCYSFQSYDAPKFYMSRTFDIVGVTDKDLTNIEEFANFFGVPNKKPFWRHAICEIMVTADEMKAAEAEPETQREEEYEN